MSFRSVPQRELLQTRMDVSNVSEVQERRSQWFIESEIGFQFEIGFGFFFSFLYFFRFHDLGFPP